MSNQNNRLIGIKTNIVYGNPVVKKEKDYKNDARPLSSEYSNVSWQDRITELIAMELPEKKGGRK